MHMELGGVSRANIPYNAMVDARRNYLMAQITRFGTVFVNHQAQERTRRISDGEPVARESASMNHRWKTSVVAQITTSIIRRATVIGGARESM
jgi:hypothetical protein